MRFNPFKILFALDNFLVRIEKFILITTLISLLSFAFLQVVLRNVFDTAIHWGDVFNRMLVIWIGFFAATIAAKENRHLSLEVLTKFIPERALPVVNIFVQVFVIVVTAILTKASCGFFQDQIMFESSDLLFEGLPKAYFTIIFPIGFGLICFRYVVKLLETIYTFAGGDQAYAQLKDDDEVSDFDISVKMKIK
ncbi:MAG: TRAP transporter small permease [bacterium]|nr:TRAP transporter small permease [bacterium]MBU1916886.1 TRAP transporter small permease [bacterium]